MVLAAPTPPGYGLGEDAVEGARARPTPRPPIGAGACCCSAGYSDSDFAPGGDAAEPTVPPLPADEKR